MLSNPKNTGDVADTALEDMHMTANDQAPSNEVIFGVYGADDWILNTEIRKHVEAGRNTLSKEGTWITPAGWDMHEWISGISERFNFMSMNRALVFMPWGMIEATQSRGKLDLELNGIPEEVLDFLDGLDKKLKRAENLIEWVYSTRGQSISMPLNYKAALPGFYPWLPGTLDEFIDGYLDSNASVLILIGRPGTGKTTFIKNLIHRSGGNAKVTYDEKVMADDSLFAHFIEGDTRFMIMEDADAFLQAREDGNTMMHRFLNVSDGLISAEGKKLVFSTNLPSINHVDSALIRPGRCYAVVEFRPLTRVEATVVAKQIYGDDHELPDGSEFTLAQLYNTQPMSDGPAHRRVGF